MLTLLIIFGSIAGYSVIGVLTYKLSANAFYTREYRRILSKGVSFNYYDKVDNLSDKELECKTRKKAWNQALDSIDASSNAEVLSPIGGFLWPIGIPAFLAFFLLSWVSEKIDSANILSFKPKAIREIESFEASIEAEKIRKVEWSKSLDQAEAMGVDVTELRKL